MGQLKEQMHDDSVRKRDESIAKQLKISIDVLDSAVWEIDDKEGMGPTVIVFDEETSPALLKQVGANDLREVTIQL